LLFGAFLAAAILSGSLVVGDSVRASLREAASQRLGRVESGLLGGDRWFTETLATSQAAAPLILMQGSVSAGAGNVRANAVQVLGVDDAFWKLSPAGQVVPIEKNGLIVNEALARRLGVKAGETVLVRMELPSVISRDAPLSGSTNQEVTMRRKVSAVVGAEAFGSFQLAASQTGSDTVYVPLADMQAELEKSGLINAMLAGSGGISQEKTEQAKTLEDFALKLVKVEGSAKEWELGTDRVFMDEVLSQKLLAQQPGAYGVVTYLVNGFSSANGRTPYSMVTGLPQAVLESKLKGTVTGGNGKPGILISQWLAEDHQLAPGGEIAFRFFTVGLGRDLQEQTATCTVTGVVAMDNPDLNRAWTPNFPGVSDVDNCRDWEPGIPVKLDAIRDKDEEYWDTYRGTPKAFISLEEGQKLWGNRFGNLTSIRFPETGQAEAELKSGLLQDLSLADIGLVPRDFKAEAGAAAQGSVDFGGLFVGLSMFLIGAALVFAALLFLFTIEKRSPQVGLLLALGWSPRQARWAVLAEAGLVAVVGSALGLLGGIVYTKLALDGLNGAWSGATVGFQLTYAAHPGTLLVSFVASTLAGLGTLWWASRQIFKAAPKNLLVGEAWAAQSAGSPKKRAAWRRWLPVVYLVLAIALSALGSGLGDPQAVSGAFFGAGFLLLLAGATAIGQWLRRSAKGGPPAGTLGAIGLRNLTRRPGRSLAVIGMMAGGIFLVIAVNAFRLAGAADPTLRGSGTGGFVLLAESSLPIYEDLNSEAAWDTFALDEKRMADAKVVPFRIRDGDDASCLNLNRAQQPVLTAVNARLLAERKSFTFAGGAWTDLNEPVENGAIPGIADQATALWGLGKSIGDTIAYTDAQGREFQVQLVGLVTGSVLQGKIIVSEANFLSRFPDAAGYKYFLIDTPPDQAADLSGHLTKQLESRGVAIETTSARLAAFQAVQNTYIGIFTVLGGLGVLLGTAGLGVLAARNILERRGELGLMQALGFQPGALRKLVMSEHTALLVAGLLLGLVSAGIAVWPNVRQSGGALPTGFLVWLTLGILCFGMVVCFLAAYFALRGRLMDAVRRE
jgi:ABC-type antimicrobial peptide transport system permease subunit